MNLIEAKKVLKEHGYRLVEDSQEIPVNTLEKSRYIKRLIKLYNDSGYLFINDVAKAVESDDEHFYVINGDDGYMINVAKCFLMDVL